MPDYSLVPVDYQPDFGDYSLVPVDYDPFAADGVAQQSQVQQAQAQPQDPSQQPPARGAGQPDARAPAATPVDPLTSNGVLTPLTENGRVDSMFIKNSPLALHQQALRLVLPTATPRSLPLTTPNPRISVGSMDIR